MNSCNLVATITGIACTLSNCLSEEELAILAAALTQLGDTIATILTNEEIRENCCNGSSEDFDLR
ncbi:DUF6774 domain-containing protein [Anaerosporobacter sp.]|uniref:DUF6774 domain-containing protein n=1 Tax=Anaerosporobacter sp. TaxID=1872529 RepID=UPI00286EE948|nr:DUF6774 domain-containing protein [Anaerosporobacter sp.]